MRWMTWRADLIQLAKNERLKRGGRSGEHCFRRRFIEGLAHMCVFSLGALCVIVGLAVGRAGFV